MYQQHAEAAPSQASKDSRRDSVALSAGGWAPRKSAMRQPRDSGAFLCNFPATLRLPRQIRQLGSGFAAGLDAHVTGCMQMHGMLSACRLRSNL